MAISIFYNLGASSNVVKSDTTYQEETSSNLNSSSLLKMFNILKDLSAKKKNYTADSTTTLSTSSYEIETFFNIWRNAEFNKKLVNNTLNYSLYEENYVENWDNISQNYYNNDGLWWIIAITNGINNPFEEIQTLNKLKILNSGYLSQLLQDVEDISKL